LWTQSLPWFSIFLEFKWMVMANSKQITVQNLEMAYGSFVVMRDLNFIVETGKVTVIMGGSGCGKSTLLRHMIGLHEPAKGSILYGDMNFTEASEKKQDNMKQRFGVLYQGGALWSSMTLEENISLPLQTYTGLTPDEIRDVVSLKLSLVGLGGFEEFLPGQLSGGMRKRAALARAIALDPDFLFFDEPSAGLDPVTSKRLDELILQLRDTLGATIVVVSHELASIFAIADHAIYLDAISKSMTAQGLPAQLKNDAVDSGVREFLSRGVSPLPSRGQD
jgi:phospholipid/cholesterol/gamma-HCH transport system ATP-binding protein